MSQSKLSGHQKSADLLPMNLMNRSMPVSELLSALADGQLAREDCTAVLRACAQDASALDRWNTYHLIGDVLRSPQAQASGAADGELAFVSRLSKRLAQELPITAQAALSAAAAKALDPSAAALIDHRGAASNDSSFRWKLVAGVASITAISVLAWNASTLLLPASSPQLAQVSSAQIMVSSPQGLMVRDARLEALLAAHKQFGATSALQEPSGFLRNATFEIPQDGGLSGR